MAVNDGSKGAGAPETTAVVGGIQTGALPEGTQKGGAPVAGQNATKSGPWIEQVPVTFRGRLEPLGIATIGSYVEKTLDLLEGKKETAPPAKTVTASKYTFEKNLGEIDPYGEVSTAIKSTLESSGVSEEVASKLFDQAVLAFGESTKKLTGKEGAEACEKVMHQKWGDQYQHKKTSMTRAMATLVKPGSDLMASLTSTGAVNNPAVAELLALVGEGIREDGAARSNQSGGAGSPEVPIKYPH